MTALAPLREQLVNDYTRAIQGRTIAAEHDVSPVPLAQDYIQFLLQRRLAPIMGNAKDWAGKNVGRQLANIPYHEPTSRHDAPARRDPWATFFPSPFVPTRRRHREDIWPIQGDLVVFDASGPDAPFGTLGVFIHHRNHPIWYVYTQGPRPPAVVPIDTRTMRPLGWWRVTDNWLLLRDTASHPITPQTGARQ